MITEYIFEFNWGFDMKATPGISFAEIQIRYEGLNADNHEMELASLATSWQGLAKIIASAADIACYNRLVDEKKWQVKVTTKAEIQPGSILTTIWVYVNQSSLFSNLASTIFATILGYWLSNRKSRKELEKKLKEVQLQLVKEQVLREIDVRRKDEIIESLENERERNKLAEAIDTGFMKVKASGRKLVNPINRECETITAKIGEKVLFVADKKSKDIFRKERLFGDTGAYQIYIRKLDKLSGHCSVFIIDENDEGTLVEAEINDAKFFAVNNEYLDSFANRAKANILNVNAYPELSEEGEIIKLFITDLNLNQDDLND